MTKYRAAMHPDTMDRLMFLNGNSALFERALQEMGGNWKPSNIGSRTVKKTRREDGLAGLNLNMEQLVFKKRNENEE